MINWFSYNGKDSRDFGLFIRQKQLSGTPQRDVTILKIPGKSRDLVIDNGRYDNIDITYDVTQMIREVSSDDDNMNYQFAANDINRWLVVDNKYHELQDSYEPEYYRKARYISSSLPTRFYPKFGKASIKFDCDPYKYNLTGKKAIIENIATGSAKITIKNPEMEESLPYIKLSGSGDIILYLNAGRYYIKNVDEYVEIDSEFMNCYKNTENKNSDYVSDDFPKFQSGKNTMTIVGATKIEIIPRWRKI